MIRTYSGNVILPKNFEEITKLNIRLIDESLRKGETPKELMFLRGGENKMFKEKLEYVDTVNMNFANFLQSPEL